MGVAVQPQINMTTKQIKLTDRQISKLSAWLNGKFSLNAGAVFNVKSIGEMYKRSLIKWLVKSPARVDAIMQTTLEATLMDVIGVKKDSWGSYKVVGGSRIQEYLDAIFQKYLRDHEKQIEVKANQAFLHMLDKLQIDTYDTESRLKKSVDAIVEEEIEALEKVFKDQYRTKIQIQLNHVFKEINESTDFADPNSLKTEWSELMVEMQLLNGEI